MDKSGNNAEPAEKSTYNFTWEVENFKIECNYNKKFEIENVLEL